VKAVQDVERPPPEFANPIELFVRLFEGFGNFINRLVGVRAQRLNR
jgi:hypothetical protein